MAETEPIRDPYPEVCPVCGSPCDDVQVGFDSSGSPLFQYTCPRGKALLSSKNSALESDVSADNLSSAVASRIVPAIDLLQQSEMPLVTGLSGVGMECQQLAMKLARRISGIVDVDAHPDRSKQFAFQRTGGVTATLGEVRNRADLILCWCFDPRETHPRLLERCRVESKKLIVVGPQDWTSGKADFFVEMEPGRASQSVAVCQAVVDQMSLDPRVVLETTGVSLNQWDTLVERLCQQERVACFVGSDPNALPMSTFYDRMAQWVIQLNSIVRFYCLFPNQIGNRLAAEDVLCMNTGFPSAVSAARRQPEFTYAEYATETLLARQEIDAMVILSGQGFQEMNPDAQQYLQQVPKIMLLNAREYEWFQKIGLHESDVWLETADKIQGDWARMDNVLLPLNIGCGPGNDTASDILESLLGQLSPK